MELDKINTKILKNKRFEIAEDVKSKLNEIKKLKLSLTNQLSKINFKDIKLEKTENHNNNSYSIIFPEKIISLYNEIKLIHDNEIDERKKRLYFYHIYDDESNKHDELAIRIQIYNLNFNRIHNPGNGLSQTFRNLGLGKKIFKRIIKEVGYITSEYRDSFGVISNSIQSDLLWHGLHNDKEVNCKSDGNKFFACFHGVTKYDKISDQYLQV